ncbi:DUF1624 domain-containing protein [Bacteriovorax stolpii]|uniref:Uncharacterized protein n=1 Tax=Bacteriovorax stolpii TaxID=960 RepID=A0A2K9NSW6_BACTC|nr:heparan-alpha-glucosaminide N-acetyltransferase [Bacteriovorax stolpii]AUN98577.1 hypothetical protein C0V70_10785 [Bacteriovorax stolpii]QDK41443.1 DUF1624 domain-containing protein [Bacteriovorax stolpii]TDP55919.1 putative membrane protein [Bacteriovorax stolpii]
MEEVKHKNRSLFLDVLRGFTVVLMIIFHFSFDLDYFGLVSFDIVHHPFWYFFPRLIVFLFLFAVGVALTLAHREGIKWKPFFKRLLLIVFWAVVISAVTYKFFPNNWIYFGTLHSIAVVSVMSLPFLKRPREALIIGLCLFIPSITMDKTIPWIQLPHSSWDYISPFPWVGASLLGIFAAHKGIQRIEFPQNSLVKSLNYLGKHSLFVYLIHQPILFGILMLVVKVIRS